MRRSLLTPYDGCRPARPCWGVVQPVGHHTVNVDGEGSNPSAPANSPSSTKYCFTAKERGDSFLGSEALCETKDRGSCGVFLLLSPAGSAQLRANSRRKFSGGAGGRYRLH